MSEDVRLPKTIRPTHYQLTLTPDLQAFTFEGEVAISIEIASPVASITLHAIELAIQDATIVPSGGPSLPARVNLDEQAETATLSPIVRYRQARRRSALHSPER